MVPSTSKPIEGQTPQIANSILHTADILRNALNVKSRQLSTGRSIDELAGEDADTWRGVDTGRVTQENGLFRVTPAAQHT